MNFIEKFRTKQQNQPSASVGRKMPRSTEPFIMIRASQRVTLRRLNSARCWDLFTILVDEDFQHRGKTFILPIDELATQKGLSRPNLRLTLRRLEMNGLILVQRRAAKPPLIKVL
jgi:hypothetical protein